MKYSDAELLALVGDEKKRSIGFDINSELIAERVKALEYIKGEMSDLPQLPNRSTAVSTDVADAIETWLSDMVEILAGGEDVVSFAPSGPDDEEAARQETDYVNHVFFNENPGFMTLYTMLKDAGETKTGVVTWWEEEIPQPEPSAYSGLTAAQIAMLTNALSGSLVQNVRPSAEQGLEPLFDCEVTQKPRKRVRVDAVNPADFTVAADTKRLSDTTYCAMRLRPRAQDLLADGVEPDIVDRLAPYTGAANETEELARDTAGEHETGIVNAANSDLRQVEIVKHYIRLVGEDRTARIWCVRTSNDDAVLIDKEECDLIPFAAITPYPVTHRFYGLSIADKAMEPQKVRTVLTRAALDTAHFALNQRAEVSEEQSTPDTIPDLLRNEPLMPVRSKTGNAVRPLQSPGLGFDPFNALEYFATVVEARTGVVRNAQGLNPDTLHDTAAGAQILVTAAQKRTRLMARIFAETGIKDVYLGVHALLRRIGGMTSTIRLRGTWVDVDPTSWGQRNDMTVEVGVGASGKAQDLAAMGAVIGKQAEAVQMQGGASGPLVTLDNLYASAIRFTQKAGLKDPERFWSNPANAPPPQPQADPKAQAAALHAQNDQAQLQLDQGKLQLDQQKALSDAHLDALRISLDEQKLQLEQAKLAAESDAKARAHEIELTKIAATGAQARDKLAADTALRLADINAKYSTSITVAQIKSNAEQFRAGADVIMQAAAHEHDHAMEAHRAASAAASDAASEMTDAERDDDKLEGDNG